MHIYLCLKPVDVLELPLSYNYILQAAIYSSIEPELAAFLHKKGFEGGGRNFKLFSFSRLSGQFQIDKNLNKIRFTNTVHLVVSSPLDQFCQSIATNMLSRRHIRLGNCSVDVEKMTVQQFKASNQKVVLKTLSPIVVYSTLMKPDGRKYTCYFQPGEPDYDSLIENNLRKKYQAFYSKEAPEGEVHVRKLGQMRQNVVNYKDTVIKGYSGKVIVTGPEELLQMAVDAGIGSKNSQGFGCVEVS